MVEARASLTVDRFTDVARATFGGRRGIVRAERLRGGTRKGVYRLTLDDATTCVAYVWRAEEDFWRPVTTGTVPADRVGAGGSGIDLFETAHAELARCGVRVPEIIHLCRGERSTGGDAAIVADVTGGMLEALSVRDPAWAGRVLDRLAVALAALHRHRRAWPGRPGIAAPPAADPAMSTAALDRALTDLAESASRVPRIAAVQRHLADALRSRFAVLTPRHEFGLIHGELGPDHVLVDDADRPVLIDIEDVRFADVEREHAFLEIRFGVDYRRLAGDVVLDHDRLRFYRLALYLSLVAGPLRLLDGDFPDRAGMRAIVAQNIGRAVAELG